MAHLSSQLESTVERINVLRSIHGGKQLTHSKKLSLEAHNIAAESLTTCCLTIDEQVVAEYTKVIIRTTEETLPGEEAIQKHYSAGSSLYKQDRTVDETTFLFLCVSWKLCTEVGVGVCSKPGSGACFVVLFQPCKLNNGSVTENLLAFQDDKAIKLGLIAEGSINELMIKYHNAIREHHSTPPLEFNHDLVIMAEKIASNKHAVKEVLKSTMVYGMNYWTGDHIPFCHEVCSEWYETIESHNFDSSETEEKSRPFCQMIWGDTSKIGCSIQKICDTYIVVCVYSLAGIVGRLYREKALRAKNKKKFNFKKFRKSLHDRK